MSIFFNNSSINDWDFGTSNIVKVYRNNAIVFYKVSGDSPTPSFDGKWLATYIGGTTSSAECDSTSAITANEITKTKTNLESVVIGDCVTSISNYAFDNCTSLTSIDIPNSVTSISNYAFRNCTSLSSCTIGSGVTSIGQRAFQGCTSLSSIIIPSGVTTIIQGTFNYCTSLTSITVNATTPPALGSYAFDNTPIASGTGYIYVPSESVETYKAASGWSDYSSRIQAKP